MLLRILATLVIAILAANPSRGAERGESAASRRPNIIVILADDLGYADLGFQGCKDIPTPHLDALAASGVRCTNGYVSGPYCSPTRAGLLTGRYQERFGHEFNPGGQAEERGNAGLPVSETTMADRLKAAGYVTGLVGKWHLGAAPKFHPQRRGFDEFFGFLGGAHAYFPERGAAPIYRGPEVVEEREYLTDAFAREAVAFIDRHQKEEFFLYLAFNAVHTPMHATDARLAKFSAIEDKQRRTYAAMTSAMDDAVGQVLDKVRSAGLTNDTLVFFFSDNGGPTMRTTTINGSRNTPLRGSKRTTLEGGVRVPFVVSWPGKLPAGKTFDRPLIQLDVQPTALAAAGIEAQPDWKLDGVNLLPHLQGEASAGPHDTLYWRFGEQMAMRRGDWKLVRYDALVDDGRQGTVSPVRLYNLADDVGESRDLAADQPERVKELTAVWSAWNAQLARPLWGQRARSGGE
ncbi:MAG TPA: sulfatase [Pirellulales bacterium]|nr:sulfatase [Pirellulales bacterium]